MQLNLGTKKNFSEANMRRIISILTGLMSSVSSLEDQCIKEYNDTVTYQKGQIVIGSDGYFYEAKTVATGTWDSSKWTKIGTDEFTELDVDTIKGFLGLTQDQLDTLAKIISDDTIELLKTWSSSKIYTDIQDALKEAKQYCITELAKKSTGSFKKANDTTEVTDGNYLYLILNPSTSKYDIYALVDSNVELLTSVDVNLDNYYTKTETEADYLKKTDATSTYATITTVDGKVDKTSILSSTSNTATDDQVYSAKVMNTELNGVVKKTDISTTIDNTSTNDTVPTSLAVRNAMLGIEVSDNTTYGDDILYFPCGYYKIRNNATAATLKNLPISSAGVLQVYSINSHNSDLLTGTYTYRMYVFIPIGKNDMYIRNISSGSTAGVFTTDTGWKKVCTAKVSDVPVTNITTNLVSTKVALDNSDSYATYYVKSGTCYVTIWSLRLIEACSVESIFNGLPKSTIGVTCPLCNGVESFAQVFMSPNSGVIAFNANASLVNKSGYCSFSYPVAES